MAYFDVNTIEILIDGSKQTEEAFFWIIPLIFLSRVEMHCHIRPHYLPFLFKCTGFFALIIACFQKYDKNAGMGTIIATMIPYSLLFFNGWSVLLIACILLGLSPGPGAGLYYELRRTLVSDDFF